MSAAEQIKKHLSDLKEISETFKIRAKACENERSVELQEMKVAMQNGNRQVAWIHAQNAVKKRNEGINLLSMSAVVDDLTSRIQSAVQVGQVAISVEGIFSIHIPTLDIPHLLETLQQLVCVSDLKHLVSEDQVNILMGEVADELTLELKCLLPTPPGTRLPSSTAEQNPLGISIPSILENISSLNPQNQLAGVQSCKKLLSVPNPPLDEIMESVPKLVQLLDFEDNPNIQFEAACCLACIASGKSHHIKTVVDSGAVPYFIRLLSNEHPNMVNLAMGALSHITRDGPECRDCCIQCGIILPLLELIPQAIRAGYLDNIARTASNLLVKLLTSDKSATLNTAHNIVFIMNRNPDLVSSVIVFDLIPVLCQLLVNNEIDIISVALEVLKSIFNAAKSWDLDEHVRIKIIECNGLIQVQKLMQHENCQVKDLAFEVITLI